MPMTEVPTGPPRYPRTPRPLTPSPLTAAATMNDRGGEGVEDMGDGGSFAPPSPRNSLPSPCPIPVAARVSPSRGSPSLRSGSKRGQGVGAREASASFRNLEGGLGSGFPVVQLPFRLLSSRISEGEGRGKRAVQTSGSCPLIYAAVKRPAREGWRSRSVRCHTIAKGDGTSRDESHRLGRRHSISS